MENIWKLIEKALGMGELHSIAAEAKKELHELKDKVEGVEEYVPQEFPKMLDNGKIVYNAQEESEHTSNAPVEGEIVPVQGVPVGNPAEDNLVHAEPIVVEPSPVVNNTPEPVLHEEVVETPIVPAETEYDSHYTGSTP